MTEKNLNQLHWLNLATMCIAEEESETLGKRGGIKAMDSLDVAEMI